MSSALQRAVLVLEILRAADDDGLSIRGAAELTGLSKSAVQRIVSELVETELAVQDATTRRYRLGPRLLALAASYHRKLDVRHVALPHMARLRAATDETVGLTIRTADQIMHIEQMESSDELRATFDVGRRLPLWSGAPSRLFLAEESEEERHRILTQRAPADVVPAAPPGLEVELAAIRTTGELGYATAFEETTKGVNTISAPIRDAAGQLVATLSLTAPSRRLTPDDAARLAPQAIAVARGISGELGAPNDGGPSAPLQQPTTG